MNWTWIALGLGWAVSTGCSQTEQVSGTNTNWLKACKTVTECGDLGCSCGHCTPSCASDADCAAVNGICSPLESAVFECQGVTSQRLCLPRCSSSSDCGPDQLCYRGACTHRLEAMNCASLSEALVCEDFEGALDGYASVVTSGNSAQSVIAATPSGARALEARVGTAPSTAYLRADFAPLSSGSLSARAWIQVPLGQTAYDLAPLGFWSSQEQDWALRVVLKDNRLEAWSYTTPLSGSAAISPGEWHCVQFDLDIGDSGHVRIALDGTSVVDMTNFDTLPNGGVGAVSMGTLWAGATASVLVDRVLVSTTPLGCWQ